MTDESLGSTGFKIHGSMLSVRHGLFQTMDKYNRLSVEEFPKYRINNIDIDSSPHILLKESLKDDTLALLRFTHDLQCYKDGLEIRQVFFVFVFKGTGTPISCYNGLFILHMRLVTVDKNKPLIFSSLPYLALNAINI